MPLSTAACARACTTPSSVIATAITRVSSSSTPINNCYRPQSLLSWSFRPASGAAAESSLSSLCNNCWSMRSSSDSSPRSSGALITITPPLSVGRKASIVQVVAVQRHQGTSKLLRQVVMPQVRRASKVVFLEDEQDIPLQRPAHMSDQPCRHVRVGVDARPRRQPFRMRSEFRRKRSHSSQF